MAFIEALLPTDVTPGSSGSVGFSTTIKQLRGGGEHRNQLWAQPLRMFDIAYGSRTVERIESELQTFMLDVAKGASNGFRARDWSDYQATREQCGVADGTAFWFRLYKRYGAYQRRIMKPHTSTVTIYVDGDLIDPDTWFIDGVNGTVIFATAPAANSIVTWSGEFHVPVRFDSDDMTINMLTHAKGNLGALGLRELRVREDIDADEYDNLRGFLTEFDKTDLDTMLDLLHVHVNTNWGA